MPGEGAVAVIVMCAYAVAGLVDLALLPFRPLLPRTFYVGTAVVQAARVDPKAPPAALGHYLVQAPAGSDWYRITPPDVSSEAAQLGPGFGPKPAPFPGARLLFIRKPTSQKPLALRGLTRVLESKPAPKRGRMEPAAFVGIESLDPGEGALDAQLAALIERRRVAPNGGSLPGPDDSRYQVERTERTPVEIGGLSCVRDDLVFLFADTPGPGQKVSRHLASGVACADPACPGQAITLLVRAAGKDTRVIETEAQAFLAGLHVNKGVSPVCASRESAPPAEVR